MKKLYSEPELELIEVQLLNDVLGNSQFSTEPETEFGDTDETEFDDGF